MAFSFNNNNQCVIEHALFVELVSVNSKTSQLLVQDRFSLCTDGSFCNWSVALTVTNQQRVLRSDVASALGHRPPLVHPNIVVRL